jgi:hypothetical protein
MAKLEDLRQKHPGKSIARVKTQGREYYVAAPTRAEWHSFLDTLGTARAKVSMENLAKKCAIDPSAEELDRLFDRKPGLSAKLSEAIGQLAGVDDEAEIELFESA